VFKQYERENAWLTQLVLAAANYDAFTILGFSITMQHVMQLVYYFVIALTLTLTFFDGVLN
jgi:hypothetical protein